MSKLVVSVFFCTAVFLSAYVTLADVAAAATSPPICYAQEKECLDRVKDSPNDIDRDLCAQAKNGCLANCLEESRAEEERKKNEQDLKAQEEKALWGSQGLTPDEQQQIRAKREQEIQERRDAAEKAQEDKAEQERLRLIDEASQREREKQEQQENGAGTGVPTLQLSE